MRSGLAGRKPAETEFCAEFGIQRGFRWRKSSWQKIKSALLIQQSARKAALPQNCLTAI